VSCTLQRQNKGKEFLPEVVRCGSRLEYVWTWMREKERPKTVH